MIEMSHLSVGYGGAPVLRDVSLAFPQGQITVLLGPNGCGKSTLLKAVLGLLPRDSGDIFYDGTELSALTPRGIAKRAAYLSQSRNVPRITAGRMVLHGRFPHLDYPRHYRKEDEAVVRQSLARAGALELVNRRMETLSGGQRQKIYLAMALAQEADTIFMDEPTTYLDVRHQLEVMEIARDLAEDGVAVVMVLHDLSQALRIADQIAILDSGTLRGAGRPDAIFQSGLLDQVFGVHVCRIAAEHGWQYYCEAGKEF